MIASMTGYAEHEIKGDWGNLRWQLRSVNHRYLELQLRLPDTFFHLESQLRDLARQKLQRGKIDGFLQIDLANSQRPSLSLDMSLAQQLLAFCETLAPLLPEKAPVSSLALLAWPGVVIGAKRNDPDLIPLITDCFAQALNKLVEARKQEGEQLASLIQGRVDKIGNHVAAITARLPQVAAQYKARLLSRLSEISLNLDASRFEQEWIYWLQKTEITEEIERLTTHLQAVSQLLQHETRVGRRLDFLVQELNREANTLAAKSPDGFLSQLAVNLKVLIEQIREQAQNLE